MCNSLCSMVNGYGFFLSGVSTVVTSRASSSGVDGLVSTGNRTLTVHTVYCVSLAEYCYGTCSPTATGRRLKIILHAGCFRRRSLDHTSLCSACRLVMDSLRRTRRLVLKSSRLGATGSAFFAITTMRTLETHTTLCVRS